MRKKKKTSETLKRLSKSHKLLINFLKSIKKNYESMKQKMKTIWAAVFALLIISTITSCNVTRKITTESSYFQKGDTACTITTKTTEIYDASKKN